MAWEGWKPDEEVLDRQKHLAAQQMENLSSENSGMRESYSFDTRAANFSGAVVDDSSHALYAVDSDMILLTSDPPFAPLCPDVQRPDWRRPVGDRSDQQSTLFWPQLQLSMKEKVGSTHWNVSESGDSGHWSNVGTAPVLLDPQYNCATCPNDTFPNDEVLTPQARPGDRNSSSFVIGNQSAFPSFKEVEKVCRPRQKPYSPGHLHPTHDPNVQQRQPWLNDYAIHPEPTGFEPATSADLIPATRVSEGTPSNPRNLSCVRCRALKKKASSQISIQEI